MNAKGYDLIFIYREAFMIGTKYFERRLYKTNVPIIFDFDDAIWLKDTSDANKELDWLKRTSKTADICKMSSLVIVGNSFLANYAKQYNENIAIIPTTIDTNYHKPNTNSVKNDKICIGWTGSSTTIKHFVTIAPTLKKLKETFKTKIEFCVISDNIPIEIDLPINFIKWDKDKEIEQLQRFDIGIMPLPDNEWAKGKCGFKGLQYMSLEIPTIMSPIGVNKEIINNGENGFLANSEKEWIDKLTLLISNKELRETLGKKGRKTIEDNYSISSNKENYIKLFNNLINNKT